MSRTSDSLSSQVYRIKITLVGLRPLIWRRVLVPADTCLDKLHAIIQRTMGWEEYHMHQFHVGRVRYSEPHPEMGTKDESRVTIADVAPRARSKFVYEYDFGDTWLHEIKVEKIEDRLPGAPYPMCLDGERACPPEDCGGIGGYAELLEILADPKHEEHAERLEWLGGQIDPEAFDLGEANRGLKPLQRRIRKKTLATKA